MREPFAAKVWVPAHSEATSRHRNGSRGIRNESGFFESPSVCMGVAGSRVDRVPRPLRVFVPDWIYHVASRGSDRRPLFLFDQDREEFLERLGWAVERHELPCLAYCLMGNHYHLIVQTPDARLSKALQELNSGYSRRFNRVHEHSAHLSRNRYLAQLIATEPHLLMACRYVAHNPVRAGLCGEPSDSPWSSYRASAGIDPVAPFLDETALRDALGPGPRWRTRYRDFVELPTAVNPLPRDKKLLF